MDSAFHPEMVTTGVPHAPLLVGGVKGEICKLAGMQEALQFFFQGGYPLAVPCRLKPLK